MLHPLDKLKSKGRIQSNRGGAAHSLHLPSSISCLYLNLVKVKLLSPSKDVHFCLLSLSS